MSDLAGVPDAAITAYGGCRDMTCGCIPARAYCAGRAIRELGGVT